MIIRMLLYICDNSVSQDFFDIFRVTKYTKVILLQSASANCDRLLLKITNFSQFY